jgi:hypothetical protein
LACRAYQRNANLARDCGGINDDIGRTRNGNYELQLPPRHIIIHIGFASNRARNGAYIGNHACNKIEVSIMAAVDLKAQIPAMNCIPDYVIDQYLARSELQVGDGFPDGLREWAVFNHAAHFMSAAGLVKGAIPAGLTSFKSGTFSATVSDTAAAQTGFDASPYGREYKRLMDSNHAGPFLVSGFTNVC